MSGLGESVNPHQGVMVNIHHEHLRPPPLDGEDCGETGEQAPDMTSIKPTCSDMPTAADVELTSVAYHRCALPVADPLSPRTIPLPVNTARPGRRLNGPAPESSRLPGRGGRHAHRSTAGGAAATASTKLRASPGASPPASSLEAWDTGTKIRDPSMARWSQDWREWCARADSANAVRRWGQRHEGLAGLASLGDVVAACGADRSIPQEIADRRLAALIEEAIRGDQTAIRVVLQRVLPALVNRAGARARRGRVPFGAVLDDLMASAWVVIAEYPLAARPMKVAVNVIRDAEYRLYGYVPVIQRSTIPMAPQFLPHRPTSGSAAGMGSDPADGLGDPQLLFAGLPQVLLDEVAAGFPVADARLLMQLYVFGLSVAEIAAGQGVTPRWIRYRRQQALTGIAVRLGHTPVAQETADEVRDPARVIRRRPAGHRVRDVPSDGGKHASQSQVPSAGLSPAAGGDALRPAHRAETLPSPLPPASPSARARVVAADDRSPHRVSSRVQPSPARPTGQPSPISAQPAGPAAQSASE